MLYIVFHQILVSFCSLGIVILPKVPAELAILSDAEKVRMEEMLSLSNAYSALVLVQWSPCYILHQVDACQAQNDVISIVMWCAGG
jgi:hypothetical protein